MLHSSDFFIEDSTLPIDDGIWLTATLDILRAIATGAGPEARVLALGYAGWAPGQLENEIQHNGWLHCPADPDLIFGNDVDDKYERALQKIGIDLGDAVERGRARLSSRRLLSQRRRQPTAPLPAALRSSSRRAASALIGSPKAKPCAYSQPSW